MRVKLVLVAAGVEPSVLLVHPPTTIGRGHEAQVRVPHPLISRLHCELTETDGQLLVKDLGSLNGTYVGHRRVTQAPLPSGELLTLGAVTFRVVYGDDVDEDDTDYVSHRRRDSTEELDIDVAEFNTDQRHPTQSMPAPGSGPLDRKTKLQPGQKPPRK